MAKIPQYKQTVLPPVGEDLPGGSFSPIYFADKVGNAIDKAGRSVADLGATLSDITIRRQKAQEALDISNALSDLQVGVDETYQKYKLEEQDPVLFESRFKERANAIYEDVLSKQTKNVAKSLQPYLREMSGGYQTRAKSDAIKKQVDLGRAQLINSEEILGNTALEGYKQGDFEAGYEAIQKYDDLLELQKSTGLIGPDDAAAESLRFKKQITRDGYRLAIQNDPEGVLQKLQDSTDTLLDPLAQSELIGAASKASLQFQEAQHKAEKEAYTNFVETSVQNAFAGNLDTETVNSPDFKSKFKDPADYDKVVRARSTTQVSDSDVYNKLIYRINSDPYGIKQDDIVSAEGISLQDKNKALEELQRNQEITGRPNYKAARELFDIDFKQKFGEDLSIDPAEEKAKWLRVFNSYIIDKKMEPLDAAEKVRKDYEIAGQESTLVRDDKTSSSVYGGNKEGVIDPTDSLFAGIGKSIVQGATAFPRTFWGTLATMEDITKSIPETMPYAVITQFAPEDFFKRRYEDVKGIEERFQAKGEGYKKYVNGAIRTMSEMLSQHVGTAGLGTLPSMSAGAGIDKYLESRKEGYGIPRSFAAGGVTTATEYVTEKSPLAILGRPGLKFVDRLMKGLIADVPGELEATLVEMTTVDQAILGKTHTRQEYLGALLDTAATAAMTTLGATGVTHPIVKMKSEPPGKMAPPEPAEQIMQAEITFSDFGPVFTQFKGKPKEAIAQLTKEKNGDATGALYHKDIGDIDLVWGKEGTPEKNYEDGYGLAKIVIKHPEVVDNLQDILSQTEVRSREKNRMKLESPDHKAVIRLDWNGETKNWLLTAYKKQESPPTRGRTGVSGNLSDTPPASQGDSFKVATNDMPPSGPLGETSSNTSETLRNPSKNIIQPPPESVKPIAGKESIIAQIKEDLQRGQAPQVLAKETEEGTGYTRTKSTNPEYFTTLGEYYSGISKAYVKNILDKALSGKVLTPKQTNVLDDIINAKTTEIEGQKYYYTEQLPKVTVGDLNLKEGDEFQINGEKYKVEDVDEEGNYRIKDGIVYEIDVFDKIPQPDPGSLIQKPDIQLMPSLKGFVDTGKLSIEDALEIDDVARQNNWSDDTVKQFYKGAVEGLGVQNKDTASLEQMLVTAKIKSAVYKQNAEKYKQELAETESQIERLSKLLKIEGGAPDKYEAAANDFIKNLGDLKDLKPEEIIQKAQEEFALNLDRIDTGIDVKTLITAAVKTIHEAEGISKETVTHEQTINEALKELPGIYNKVMNLKRGKPLTRQQQLAAVGWVE